MPESRYSLGISGKLGLIDKSPGNISVVLDAAVAEEWPPAANFFASCNVYLRYYIFLFHVVGLCQYFTLRTCYKAISPKPDSVCLFRRIRLMPYAIDGYYR